MCLIMAGYWYAKSLDGEYMSPPGPLLYCKGITASSNSLSLALRDLFLQSPDQIAKYTHVRLLLHYYVIVPLNDIEGSLFDFVSPVRPRD